MTSLLETLPSELVTIVDTYKQAFAGVLCRPYSDYNKDNICINNPRLAFDANTNAEKFLGDIVWKHNDKPFLVELPGVTCISGVCSEMYVDEQYLWGETGTLRMMCECSPAEDDYVKFREIMMDVYVLCLQWMYEYGASDTGKHIFARPYICTHEELDDARRMHRFCGYLKSPIKFNTGLTERHGHVRKEMCINSPQWVELSVKSEKCYKKAQTMTGKRFDLLGVVSPQVIVGRQRSIINFDLVDFSASSCRDVSNPPLVLLCDDDHAVSCHRHEDETWKWNPAFNPSTD